MMVQFTAQRRDKRWSACGVLDLMGEPSKFGCRVDSDLVGIQWARCPWSSVG